MPSGDNLVQGASVLINAFGTIAGNISFGGSNGGDGATWTTAGAITFLPLAQGGVGVAGINAAGDIVGAQGQGNGYLNAVFWSPGAPTATILNDGGSGFGHGADALAVNNLGDVAGLIEDGSVQRPAYWDSSGNLTVLASSGKATAINALGDIGGVSTGATMWSSDGSILWQSPDNASTITAINSAGDAVGFDGNVGLAAYWSPTGTEQLLAQSKPGNGAQSALALNNKGESVGFSGPDAVRWASDGAVTVLKPLTGATSAEALAINKRGAAVGYCDVPNGHGVEEVATYWGPGGAVKNLNTLLGFAQSEATGINNAGDISGWGESLTAGRVAFELLWVPKAGAEGGGTYVNAADHAAVLAASAVTSHASVGSVGHSPG
jgi:hypothetical protein